MALDEKLLSGVNVLQAIVDGGSFVRAGELLEMSQSGVSRAVARMEARLGIRLLDRTTRSVVLTDEGRRFYGQIAPLLAGLEEAAAEVVKGTSSVRGRLRVAIDPFFSRLLLGPHLGRFLSAHPELEMDLVCRDYLGDIIADGFDLAVRFGIPQVSTLVARKLLDTPILTVASPAYVKKHGHPATPGDLIKKGHVCILFRDSQTGRPFPWEFHRGRQRTVLAANGALTVNDAGTLLSTCLAGYGIAQIMQWGTEHLVRSGRLINLFPLWSDERFPLFAYHPSRHQLPPKTRAFLDFIVSLGSEKTIPNL